MNAEARHEARHGQRQSINALLAAGACGRGWAVELLEAGTGHLVTQALL